MTRYRTIVCDPPWQMARGSDYDRGFLQRYCCDYPDHECCAQCRRCLRESELRERMQSAKPRPPAMPTARDKALIRALLARKGSA